MTAHICFADVRWRIDIEEDRGGFGSDPGILGWTGDDATQHAGLIALQHVVWFAELDFPVVSHELNVRTRNVDHDRQAQVVESMSTGQESVLEFGHETGFDQGGAAWD